MNTPKILFVLALFIAISFNGYSQSFTIDKKVVGLLSLDSVGKVIVGTAFVVSKSDKVVTCEHVVKNKKTFFYRPINSVRSYRVNVVKTLKEQDIAVLKASEKISEKPLQMDLSDIDGGQEIVYIAFDLSKDAFFTDRTKITGFSDKLVNKEGTVFSGIIFPSKTIPGYSGSPIFNWSGKVIGLINAYITTRKDPPPKPFITWGVGLPIGPAEKY